MSEEHQYSEGEVDAALSSLMRIQDAYIKAISERNEAYRALGSIDLFSSSGRLIIGPAINKASAFVEGEKCLSSTSAQEPAPQYDTQNKWVTNIGEFLTAEAGLSICEKCLCKCSTDCPVYFLAKRKEAQEG